MSNNVLLHLAWSFENGIRRLIFGWLEFLPPALPRQPGHPFVGHDIKSSTARLYVARFPISEVEAEDWLASALKDNAYLPRHTLRASPGDGKLLTTQGFQTEPDGDGETVAMDLPFFPYLHGAAYVSAFYGRSDSTLIHQLSGKAEGSWLKDHLFFDILEHKEYIGAIVKSRYDENVRTVETRIVQADTHDDQLIRIIKWPSARVANFNLCAAEVRSLGLSQPVWVEMENVTSISWPWHIREVGLALFDSNQKLIWFSEPSSFIRSIVVDFQTLTHKKKIEVRTDKGTEVFESERFNREPLIIGEPLTTDSFSDRYEIARAERDSKASAEQLGLKWLDNPKAAADTIRVILGEAVSRVWIFDPYFASEELARFGPLVVPEGVGTEIITSAEHLRTQRGPVEISEHFAATLDSLRNARLRPVVRVMPGDKAPLHDRFLVVDDVVWLSGNSLSEIGKRASILIRLPHAEFILNKLSEIRRKAIEFETWIDARRQSQKKEQHGPDDSEQKEKEES